VICFIINLICAYANGSIPLGIEFSGGEMTSYSGFGVYLKKTYPLTTKESGKTGSTTIGFYFLEFVINPSFNICSCINNCFYYQKEKSEDIIINKKVLNPYDYRAI